MNITYRYLRQRMSPKTYFRIMAEKNERLLTKSTGIKYIGGIYKVSCVNELPLKAKVKCRFQNPQQASQVHKNSAEPNAICMNCWLNVLENVNKNIDVMQTAPSFLKNKERKPVSFL